MIGLDTGLLDTNHDLGINLPYSVFLRKKTVCAPVQAETYITKLTTNNTQTNGSCIYSYGPSNDDAVTAYTNGNDDGSANYTFILLPSQQNIGNRYLNIVPPYQLELDIP